MGTGGVWFLFDVAFYGTNVFSPMIIHQIFPSASLESVCLQAFLSGFMGVPAVILSIYYVVRFGIIRSGFFPNFILNLLRVTK